MRPTNRIASIFRAAAASIVFPIGLMIASAATAADSAEPMRAVLLNHDLGDPANPANLKIAVDMPAKILETETEGGIVADDFRVYVHPAGLDRDAGTAERYRARGVYLWRSGDRIFLDARTLPHQEAEGAASVRVLYAPDGEPRIETLAEGEARFISSLVDVVLAVDVSLSMSRNDPRKLRVMAARTFIDMAEKGGGVGRVALVTFNQNAVLNTPLIPLSEGAALLSALDQIGAEGLTNLDNPLNTGLAELSGARKPVVILLTDGRNEGHRYQNAHLRAAEAGVRIFSVGLSEQADHELLREMADSTGGIYFRAVRSSDLPEIYARLAAELGKRQLLHGETLETPEGAMTLPVDGTVKRLVAIADGGGRVVASGPGTDVFNVQDMTGVHVANPSPANWDISWVDAVPGQSTLAFFGDTRFFLDVFPPQLRTNHLALGATLAEDEKPLGGEKVWVEAVPGLIPGRVHLHDDGEHGDGSADDGVYGATVELPGAPDAIDLTARAGGRAWDQGDFVRQAAASALQTGEEPPGRAKVNGDVDFGILFPGETGTAVAAVELNSKTPVDLPMNLSWQNGASAWPDFSSSVSVDPGSHEFELEMTVPEDSLPGEYTGMFSVGKAEGAGGMPSSTTARVKVGGVRFGEDGAIDLGAVPPGTFISRVVTVPYEADKDAPLAVDIPGSAESEDLSITNADDAVRAGTGEASVEVVVSAPMGTPEGERTGRLVLRAGPGRAEIPLRWRVRPYAAEPAEDIAPVPGIPRAPELPADTRPLRETPEFSSDFWEDGIAGHTPAPLESPWEKTERIFRDQRSLTGDGNGNGDGGMDDGDDSSAYSIPDVAAPAAGGKSFWSAWWVYILAALLLLLLLLLLLAYILYRLGKSAMARFLLASAMANLLLLAAFIILLGAEDTAVASALPQTVSVNLVESESPVTVEFTDAEKELLEATGNASFEAPSGSGRAAAIGEAVLSESARSAGGGELASGKTARLPEGGERAGELAVSREPSGMQLENETRETLRRRDRQPEREERATLPALELEMEEPPVETAARRGESSPEEVEARVDIDRVDDAPQPVWSEDGLPLQPLPAEENVLLAEAPDMDAVRFEASGSASRLDPRGRRRSMRETPATQPEERPVELAAPVDDDAEEITQTETESPREDSGVREVRVEPLDEGTAYFGEKPGLVIAQAASNLDDAVPSRLAQGSPSLMRDGQRRTASRGGRAAARGSAVRDDAAMPESGGALPGTQTGTGDASSGDGRTGRAGGRAASGERRFGDDLEGGSSGTGGMFSGRGDSRPSTRAASGGGSPSRLVAGGGSDGEDAVPYSRPGGSGSGAQGLRGRDRRGENDSSQPGGLTGVPGGDAARSGDAGNVGDRGASGGRPRGNAVGEGRFDDIEEYPGAGEAVRTQGAVAEKPVAPPRLGVEEEQEPAAAADAFAAAPQADEWQRNERRRPPRVVNVAASAVDADGLLIVVGDFARRSDAAAANLFRELSGSVGKGIVLEERMLAPADAGLNDCLLAVLSPEEVIDWPDGSVRKVGEYLKSGGHIWMDAPRPALAKPFMDRLARAAGGEFAPLDENHQLSEGETVDALMIGGKPAAVATYQDWRKDWRRGGGNGRTMRFLKRTLNYFLSGDAESGISLEPSLLTGGTRVEPYREVIPDQLAGGGGRDGRLWDEFGPGTAAEWRMPSWSDRGGIAAVADGEGGRALKMDLGAAVKGRAAVYRTMTPPQDLTGVGYVEFDAYYDGEGGAALSMAFTVDDGRGWADYESRTLPLLTGWNRLRFNLDEASYRSLSDDGGEDGRLPSMARTGRAGFFLYRDADAPAVVLFRDIRMHDK